MSLHPSRFCKRHRSSCSQALAGPTAPGRTRTEPRHHPPSPPGMGRHPTPPLSPPAAPSPRGRGRSLRAGAAPTHPAPVQRPPASPKSPGGHGAGAAARERCRTATPPGGMAGGRPPGGMAGARPPRLPALCRPAGAPSGCFSCGAVFFFPGVHPASAACTGRRAARWGRTAGPQFVAGVPSHWRCKATGLGTG